MNLKTDIIKALQKTGVDITRLRIRYYRQSPYQKRRYKPEFIEQECWIFPAERCKTLVYQGEKIKALHGKKFKTFGICITENDWQDKDFRNMIIEDAKRITSN